MARPHGSKDKNRQFLWRRLQDMFGDEFDPIIRAAEQAARLHNVAAKSEDPKVLRSSVDSWCKVGEFVSPKIRAMELSQDPDNPLFEMTADERYSEFRRLFQTSGEGSGKGSGDTESSSKPH